MPRERRPAGRLEALRLSIVRGHVDIGHGISLLLTFGTFAVIASPWLIYDRRLSGTYEPAGLDLALIFAYLALVSLIPCATYEIARNGNSETARTTPFSYFALYATMTALSPIATVRTIRRGYFLCATGRTRFCLADAPAADGAVRHDDRGPQHAQALSVRSVGEALTHPSTRT